MNKLFKSVVNSAGVGDMEMCLYGEISSWRDTAEMFISEINRLSNICTQINIKVNCPGGEVFEGLAIFRATKYCKVPVHIYVEGMAASMASIIAMAVPKERLHISKYGSIMTHRVHGRAEGDADQVAAYAEQMQELEDILISIYSERTGKTVDFIKQNWMVTGKDVWFFGQKAVDAGLAGDVYDGAEYEVYPEAKYDDLKRIYNQYKPINNTMNKILMQMCAHYGMPDNSTEEQVMAKFRETIAANATLTNKVTNLEATIAQHETEKKEAQKTAVKDMLDKAIQDKKFTADMRADYEAMAAANFESTKKIIDSMAGVPNVTDLLNKQKQQDDARKDWTFEDYRKKAPQDLAKMKEENKEEYEKLFKAQYSKDNQ